MTAVTLLGSPIQAGGGVYQALAGKTADLAVMVSMLSLLPAHASLYLLKNVLSIPKLLYLLRTAPWSDSAELLQYDKALRSALSTLLRSTQFHKQRLSLAVQRGNAASILGTIAPILEDT